MSDPNVSFYHVSYSPGMEFTNRPSRSLKPVSTLAIQRFEFDANSPFAGKTKVAIAVCSPLDIYNRKIGKSIARGRLEMKGVYRKNPNFRLGDSISVMRASQDGSILILDNDILDAAIVNIRMEEGRPLAFGRKPTFSMLIDSDELSSAIRSNLAESEYNPSGSIRDTIVEYVYDTYIYFGTGETGYHFNKVAMSL
jgi:hypothetical protein